MKKVYVVMKNATPVAVFSTYDNASDFMAVQPKHGDNGQRLYWHVHTFLIDMMVAIHDNSEQE